MRQIRVLMTKIYRMVLWAVVVIEMDMNRLAGGIYRL
jgi:hypothetical protein